MLQKTHTRKTMVVVEAMAFAMAATAIAKALIPGFLPGVPLGLLAWTSAIGLALGVALGWTAHSDREMRILHVASALLTIGLVLTLSY